MSWLVAGRALFFLASFLGSRSKKQESRSKNQEARSKKQESRSKKQEARSKKQEARIKKQQPDGSRDGSRINCLPSCVFLFTSLFLSLASCFCLRVSSLLLPSSFLLLSSCSSGFLFFLPASSFLLLSSCSSGFLFFLPASCFLLLASCFLLPASLLFCSSFLLLDSYFLLLSSCSLLLDSPSGLSETTRIPCSASSRTKASASLRASVGSTSNSGQIFCATMSSSEVAPSAACQIIVPNSFRLKRVESRADMIIISPSSTRAAISLLWAK